MNSSALLLHQPGYSVLIELYRLEKDIPKLSALRKFFGASPLTEETKPWYIGYLGELEVGRELKKLEAENYIVLHGLPTGNGKTDVDHVVISPGGTVWALNTKHHANKTIWVSDRKILIDGNKSDHLIKSVKELDRVAKVFIDKEIPFLNFSSLLVFVHPKEITGPFKSQDIAVKSTKLVDHIRGGRRKKVADAAYSMPTSLYDPETWSTSYVDDTSGQQSRLEWFSDLDRLVRRQAAKKTLWRLLGLLVGIGAVAILLTQIVLPALGIAI